ncbi:MAG: hypothetical protein JWR21_3260 [Herminiimonas sp.]|nr:hypothetical protein [Herminiimonas sp.]
MSSSSGSQAALGPRKRSNTFSRHIPTTTIRSIVDPITLFSPRVYLHLLRKRSAFRLHPDG